MNIVMNTTIIWIGPPFKTITNILEYYFFMRTYDSDLFHREFNENESLVAMQLVCRQIMEDAQ